MFQAATLTTILSPIIIALLLLIGIHLKRIAPFEPISAAEFYHRLVPACGKLCQIGSLRFFAAVSLIALSLVSIFGLSIHWWKNRQQTDFGNFGSLVGLGLNLAGLIIGIGIFLQDLKSRTIRQLFDREENASQLIAELNAFGHSYFLDVAIWLCVFLGCAIIIAAVLGRKDQAKISRNALFCSITVCAIGVAAFVFTRKHAQDASTTLQSIIGFSGDVGHCPKPDKIESAVFGEMWAKDWLDGNFKLDPSIALPESSAAIDPKWSVYINVSQAELKIEGHTIAKLNNGIIESKYVDRQKQRIRPLYRLLQKLKEIGGHDPVYLTLGLQIDKEIPFETLDLIVKSTSQAGYRFFCLLVLRKNQRPLSRPRVAVINVSAPIMGLEKSANSVYDFYRKSTDANDERSADENRSALDAKKIFAKIKSPTDELSRDRFALLDIEDLQLETPQEDGAESHPLTLSVQIAKDGFTLTAHGAQGLEKLHFEIPKKNNFFDFQALANKTNEIHDQYPSSDTVMIRAEKDIAFLTVIKTLDATRERIVDKKLDIRKHLFIHAHITSVGATTSSRK